MLPEFGSQKLQLRTAHDCLQLSPAPGHLMASFAFFIFRHVHTCVSCSHGHKHVCINKNKIFYEKDSRVYCTDGARTVSEPACVPVKKPLQAALHALAVVC